jgi:hypothetical protein
LYFVTGTFKVQQWDIVRHDFLESAPGLGMFVTVTTYNDEVKYPSTLSLFLVVKALQDHQSETTAFYVELNKMQKTDL